MKNSQNNSSLSSQNAVSIVNKSALTVFPGSSEIHFYEVLKNNLFFSANGSRPLLKKVAVTSRYSGEGVTTIASNLAAALTGRENESILYVDLNTGHKDVFNTGQGPGLGEILSSGNINPQSLRKTNIRNLFVLPSCDLERDPSDYSGLADLLTQLESIFKYIILDIPSFEKSMRTAITVSGLADGVILVIESERVRWEVAQQTKAQLIRSKANILGAVLNKQKRYIPNFIYKML